MKKLETIKMMMRDLGVEPFPCLKISQNSKLDLPTYNGSSFVCPFQAKKNCPSSVCSECYGVRGTFRFRNVKRVCLSNELLWLENPKKWESDMMSYLSWHNPRLFRFFAAGELDSLAQLQAIMRVAASNPEVKFWLPTKRIDILKQIEYSEIPENLCIRYSGYYIDVVPGVYPCESLARTGDENIVGFPCPHDFDDTQAHCSKCKACWNREITVVSYRLRKIR